MLTDAMKEAVNARLRKSSEKGKGTRFKTLRNIVQGLEDPSDPQQNLMSLLEYLSKCSSIRTPFDRDGCYIWVTEEYLKQEDAKRVGDAQRRVALLKKVNTLPTHPGVSVHSRWGTVDVIIVEGAKGWAVEKTSGLDTAAGLQTAFDEACRMADMFKDW